MAKCALCGQRKGKRNCQVLGQAVCSQCCGSYRDSEKCEGCVFYHQRGIQRRYKSIPAFSLQEMDSNHEYDQISTSIESQVAKLDQEEYHFFRDQIVQSAYERFFDKYYYQDQDLHFASRQEQLCFEIIESALKPHLKNNSLEVIIKIVSTVYKSLRRRTEGHREYLDFLCNFYL